jgi:hypothetical protein
MRRNRRFSEIILDNLKAEERKDAKQSMMAFWLALPLAIVQLILI